MKRSHPMPFGAQYEAGRGTRFRLWAPDAGRVEVVLEDRAAPRRVPLLRKAGGWFETVVAHAAPGSLYRYAIGDGRLVPDPASRFNPRDVHGPSEVIDPLRHDWRDVAWSGRPWHEAVVYEVHVGAFTPEGSFHAARRRLPYLRDLGVTAIELMPVADFPGARNWGYDGVLLFAPDSRYGRPEDLKRLVDEAHACGMMVLLDVVYNHFGPDGNYLHLYAREFFTGRHPTPWGAAINFDGAGSRPVRDFYVHNALYWLEEFHLDGLRFDAVHAIRDDSTCDILTEIAQAVRDGPGRSRHVHLVLENDDNRARYLARDAAGRARCYDAQWNDDMHHVLHVLATGERDGYYADYLPRSIQHLGRALTEGYVYQGEHSAYRRRKRGERSCDLPPAAFVAFLQNHDQIGNRAFGDRISTLAPPEAVRAALALLLLAPSVPLLFMGEEFGCEQPFLFFCDFHGELARAVTAGRRSEFAAFARFQEGHTVAAIPDPNAESTFRASVLDWGALARAGHAAWLHFTRRLLDFRHREIVPRVPRVTAGAATFTATGPASLHVEWPLREGGRIALAANLCGEAAPGQAPLSGTTFFAFPSEAAARLQQGALPPWSVAWAVEDSA